MNGAAPYVIVFPIRIRGSFTLAGMRHALAKIQAKYPILTAGVREDKRGIPCFISDADVPEVPVRIVERRTDDDWKRETNTALITPFDMKSGPLARVVWLRSAAVSDLMLVVHHCICDGLSVVTLMREILTLLDQPDKEPGQSYSFNTIEDLVPGDVLSRKKNILKWKIIARLIRISCFFLAATKKVLPGEDYMIHWKLSKETSAALIARCKEEQVTPYAALCTALFSAFRQVKGNKSYNKLLCPVNIRRFIKAIGPDALLAFTFVVPLSMNRDPDPDFFTKARKLKSDLNKQVNGLKIDELLAGCEHLHKAADKLIEVLRNRKGAHFTCSNLGRIDFPDDYTSFEVETVYCPTTLFPWKGSVLVATATFRGQMDFSLTANSGMLRYEDALAVKDRAMEILRKETGPVPAEAML